MAILIGMPEKENPILGTNTPIFWPLGLSFGLTRIILWSVRLHWGCQL